MTPPAWRKSSRSTEGTSAQCVEIAHLVETIGIRDSKNPDAGYLAVSPAGFAALVRQIKEASA
ncbi:DUF397 domain-containing protein [Actinomadura sp. BRA 177]|uniref:DUF397 domain-containing protein n=1 Tax=Actinomadura sp. BRA 177 TaxID=2745202 RepID=UPI0015952AB0|nr:DUF397 domain-containing protein [Actinomadura sp. BRA 177]NVI90928.1 DUF397 domain-containing protein [Actinomadura sp. BRA 177]